MEQHMMGHKGNEKKSVLIVDDEPHIVSLVKLTLSDEFTIHEAYSGREAIRVAKKYKPDIIVLDLMMPGMDGYQVCNALREMDETANTPIMILSAKSQIVDKFRSVSVGADDYMVKPFEPDLLVKRIRSVLNLAH